MNGVVEDLYTALLIFCNRNKVYITMTYGSSSRCDGDSISSDNKISIRFQIFYRTIHMIALAIRLLINTSILHVYLSVNSSHYILLCTRYDTGQKACIFLCPQTQRFVYNEPRLPGMCTLNRIKVCLYT